MRISREEGVIIEPRWGEVEEVFSKKVKVLVTSPYKFMNSNHQTSPLSRILDV